MRIIAFIFVIFFTARKTMTLLPIEPISVQIDAFAQQLGQPWVQQILADDGVGLLEWLPLALRTLQIWLPKAKSLALRDDRLDDAEWIETFTFERQVATLVAPLTLDNMQGYTNYLRKAVARVHLDTLSIDRLGLWLVLSASVLTLRPYVLHLYGSAARIQQCSDQVLYGLMLAGQAQAVEMRKDPRGQRVYRIADAKGGTTGLIVLAETPQLVDVRL